MKIAIVHYWIVGTRGGEKVLEALCELYPDADIFTHVVSPDAVSPTIGRHKIRTSFISRLPAATRLYRSYLPFMPMALEELDLSEYDLIISSEAGPAKGIIPAPGAVHVCYCHSPMRYIWNMYHEYKSGAGWLARLSMPFLTHYLRMWDQSTASRVDLFVSNSTNVAARIRKYYRRDALVVHPPVDTERFVPARPDEIGDYYLVAGELVGYKRADLAVRAFNRSGRRLVVVGSGELAKKLSRMAGPTIDIRGHLSDAAMRETMARARALIFPGEEDFGIIPVEAMACGRPVIAYGRGGALETVVDGVTGLFFGEQTEDALNDAIDRFERQKFDSATITAHAQAFGTERFKLEMAAAVADATALYAPPKSAIRETPADRVRRETEAPASANRSLEPSTYSGDTRSVA